MTTEQAIEKADIALEVLLKHSELNSKITFQELMEEIVSRWGRVYQFPIPTTVNTIHISGTNLGTNSRTNSWKSDS